jgi:hypothetical protein
MKAMLQEGENIYHSHMPNVPKSLNSSISIFSINETKVLYTNTQFMAPSVDEGKTISEFKTKNHPISLLQMQGCPEN